MITGRPRVAIINQPWNPAIPPVQAGSIAIWNYHVAKRLAGTADITVFSKRVPGRGPVELHDGVCYRRESTSPDPYRQPMSAWLALRSRLDRRPLFAQPAYYRAFGRRVALALATLDPQIVHLHNLGSFAPVVRAHNPRARIILHMHCEWLSQLPEAIVAPWVAAVDLILGCSSYIIDKVRRRFPALAHRCAVLYNGVSTEHFTPNGPRVSLAPEGEPTLLFVGRLTPEKGLHHLLDAFALVLRRVPGAHLTILGPESPTPREFLVSLSDDPNLKDLARFYGDGYVSLLRRATPEAVLRRVRFLPAVPHDELPQYYRGADLLVNPSLSDAFPLTLGEAMACGTPVVATRIGGMPEILEDDVNGLLVGPGDVPRLAAAIESLLLDPDRRRAMGHAALRRVQERFSWESIAAATFRQYEQLATTPATHPGCAPPAAGS